MLDFRLLGPLEVVGDAGPIPLGAPKQRALLAILLLHAGEVVSTDRLVDDLWGTQPPRTAPSSLQNFVAQLRKLLGAELLLTRPTGYVLDIDTAQVDVKRFEDLLAAARRTAEPERRSELLEQGLALFR